MWNRIFGVNVIDSELGVMVWDYFVGPTLASSHVI